MASAVLIGSKFRSEIPSDSPDKLNPEEHLALALDRKPFGLQRECRLHQDVIHIPNNNMSDGK